MGLLTPFLTIPKLLFQELWSRGLDWDQPPDSDVANSWEIWKQPRLELLAAYIIATLLEYVIQALRSVVDTVYGWSDSQITLAWIRRPSSN